MGRSPKRWSARIQIADDALGDVRLPGILRADNIDALRELLAEVHGIRSEYRSGGEIVLERKQENPIRF